MREFSHISRKSFAHKFQWNRMLGTLALKVVREHYDLPIYQDEEISTPELTGFLRYQTLFLKLIDPGLRIQIFREQQILLEKINQHYQKLGYRKQIKTIRLQ